MGGGGGRRRGVADGSATGHSRMFLPCYTPSSQLSRPLSLPSFCSISDAFPSPLGFLHGFLLLSTPPPTHAIPTSQLHPALAIAMKTRTRGSCCGTRAKFELVWIFPLKFFQIHSQLHALTLLASSRGRGRARTHRSRRMSLALEAFVLKCLCPT